MITFVAQTRAGAEPALWKGLIPAILLPICFATLNLVAQLGAWTAEAVTDSCAQTTSTRHAMQESAAEL